MECKFQVGDMVVCIEDHSNCDCPGPLPVKGNIYTISGFCTLAHQDSDIGVFVEEIRAPGGKKKSGKGTCCQCYHPRVFRPVRKTNIEALRQLVINPKVTT